LDTQFVYHYIRHSQSLASLDRTTRSFLLGPRQTSITRTRSFVLTRRPSSHHQRSSKSRTISENQQDMARNWVWKG